MTSAIATFSGFVAAYDGLKEVAAQERRGSGKRVKILTNCFSSVAAFRESLNVGKKELQLFETGGDFS